MTVKSRILGDERQFLDSLPFELFRFADNAFDGKGNLLSADIRDGAERTSAIAAFGYFQIGVVRKIAKV